MAFAEDGSSATIHAIRTPFVTLIWIGGVLMGLGGFFAFWPARRRAVRQAAVRTRSVAPRPNKPAKAAR